MRATLHAELDVIEAAGRSIVYSMLATGMALPTRDRLALLGSRLLPTVQTLELPAPLDDALQAVALDLPTDLEQTRVAHMALFPPIASQDAPGYETAYRGDGMFQQAALMADIAGFYRAHGLRAGGDERERLDHITVELEFMAVLARKEAVSLQDDRLEDAMLCREIAALFLQDHLGCWGPTFGRRAAAVTASPWYRSLGVMTAIWIEHDGSAAGVTPVELVDVPLPQEPPDDGTCGPCPVPQEGPG
jgi:TorA maturation chaperone TorD